MDSATVGIPRDAPGGYYVTNVYLPSISPTAAPRSTPIGDRPRQQFGKYGTSHVCVGMTTAGAAWFWDFADIGTPAVVQL